MGHSTRFRWSLLSGSVLLLLPNFLAQTGGIGVDFSWLKEVPPTLFTLTIAYLVLRIINDRQGKITVSTPEGQPDKRVSKEEYLGKSLDNMTGFMRDSKTADRLLIEQAHELTKAATVIQ